MATNTPKGLTKNNTLEISQNVKDILKVLQSNNKDITKGRGKDDKSRNLPSSINGETPKSEKDKEKERDDRIEKIAQEHLEATKEIYEKNQNTIASTILGPLRMITAPLDKFTNGFLSKSVKSVLFGGQKGKTNPNKQDVVKMGVIGSGFLYLAKIMDKVDEEKKDSIFEKIGDFLKGKLGGLGKFLGSKIVGSLQGGIGLGKKVGKGAVGLAKKVGRVGGGLALAGGAVMMGVDAYKGTQQDWKDKEGKQLSKGVKGAGGLLGSIGSGFRGAFANMGKWALTGFGIGNLIVPGVGGIVGGAIGGLLGGILGFIGGEKLARGIQTIGNWFKDTFWPVLKNFGITLWNGIVGIFKGLFNVDKIKEIWSGDDNTLVKVLKTISTSLISIVTFPIKKVFMGAKFVTNLVKDTKFGKAVGQFMGSLMNTSVGKKIGNALSTAKSGLNGIKGIFDHAFDGVKWDKDKGFFNNMKDITSTIFNNIKDGISSFFKDNPLGKWIDEMIIRPIKNAFASIGYFFKFMGETYEKAGGGLKGIGAIIDAAFVAEDTGKKDKKGNAIKLTKWQSANIKFLKEQNAINDGIIRPNGDVIKTNPKDTLIALKDIDTSFRSVRQESNASSIQGFDSANVSTIINLLKRIAEKDTILKLPQQTRYDIDVLMNGGLA